MRDLATRLSLPFNPPFSPLLGETQCVYVYDVIVLLFSEGYLCLWISSGHPRHAAMSAWSGLVGFFVEMQLDSSLSLSLSLENAQGCRGCLMVLRERRSGLVGWERERRREEVWFRGEATRRVWWMRAFERKSFWLSKFASNGNVNKKFRGNRSIPSSSGKFSEIKIEFFWKSFLFKNANNSVEEFCGSDRWNSRGLVLRGFVNWERCDDW